MSQIFIQRDPANISKVERHNVDGQVNLLDWMIDNLPENMSDMHCCVIINDAEVLNTWTGNCDDWNKALDISIGAFDVVQITSRPQGTETFYLVVVAVLAAAVAIALAPKPPRVPDDTGTGNSNNQLNAASNAYGLRKAIPDIAGQVVSYPLFAQRPYFYYENNLRVWEEVFYFGEGYYEIIEAKEGDTPLDDIANYEYSFFNPDTIPTELTKSYTNPSTLDVDLLSSSQQTKSINFDGDPYSVVVPNRFNIGAENIEALVLNIGDTVTINISTRDGEGIVSVISVTATIDTVGSDYFLTTGAEVADNGIILSGYIANEEFVPEFPWYYIGDAEEVWFNLKMPSGIRKGDGTAASVTATLIVEELDEFNDPTGVTYSRGAVFYGNTQEAQYQTFRMTTDDGLPSSGKYRAQAARATPYLGDNSLDLLTLDGITAISRYTPNFTGISGMQLKRKSSQRVNRGSSEKINVKLNRKLRIYDNDTGIYGETYETTRRYCDYVFYLLYEKAGYSISEINTDELFGIHDNLPDAYLGYFDYTFDDKNTSLRERVEIACNVARVRHWMERGYIWSFVRTEEKTLRSVMFNRRNLLSGSSQYVQKFTLPSATDGINLKYVNPDNNTEKTISKRIVANAITTGEGNNPREITLAGCRDHNQAMNRLNLEIRKLFYQTTVVKDTARNDAQLVRLGDRVDWVDVNDGDTFDGEILSVSGDVYTTSERFEPVDGVDYYVYITDENGEPSNSVLCTARADGNIMGFEAAGLVGVYTRDNIVQIGSRYLIASASDAQASSYTLESRGVPNENGECSIELVEYNPLIFADD